MAENLPTRQGEIEQILANSSDQRKVIIMAKSILEKATEQMCRTLFLDRITIVDLGCSSGPNALSVVSQVLDIISKLDERQSKEEERTLPEIQFILNDLPSNDFNSVFQSLEEFNKKIKEERGNLLMPYYVAAASGSFHGRLFPSSTVQFFYCSTSLHWLSQAPKELGSAEAISQNRGNIYFTKTSPPWIVKAYREQFQRDFSTFLESRFEELSVGGGALLIFPGREGEDEDGDIFNHISELFSDSLNAMAEEGIISKDKLDAFNMPFYSPLLEEVKSIILNESSFDIEQAHLLSYKWLDATKLDILRDGKMIANGFRAWNESLFAHHFGDAILDELFERFAEEVSRGILEEKLTNCSVSNIIIELKKNTPP
ncbi:probable jasmonic acid carboxyl methyltransferase 2 [Zingiber officinale]|nr:probable jasmonic acid carboxyl methyltransferase 2 [Zingiber officinale]